MANLQEIVDRAAQLATGAANDAFESIIADAGYTYEVLYPHAARYALLRLLASNEATTDELAAIITIAMVDGVGTLPENVLFECLEDASINDYPFAAFLPYEDYARTSSLFTNAMSYWATSGKTIYFTPAGGELFNANLALLVPAIPALPAVITDPIPMNIKLTEAVILALASAMKGEISLMSLMNT